MGHPRSPLGALLLASSWALGSLLAAPPATTAQEVGASLDFGLSHARPPADIDAEAASYLLAGGRVFAGPLFASLYGGLAPNDDAGNWAAGELGLRLVRSLTPGLAVGLGLQGSAFALGAPTSYRAALGRATPEVTLSDGPTRLRVRGHGGVGRSEVLDVISDLWTYGAGAEIGHDLRSLSLTIGGDIYESAGGSYRTGYLMASAPVGATRWDLEGRLWEIPNGDLEAQARLTVSVPLSGRLLAAITGGRDGPDPLLNSPAAVNGSFLVSWDVTGPPEPDLPTYTVERRPGRTTVLFRLEAPEASAVSVSGDFSGWEPVPMRRVGGAWQVRIPIEAGLYHFGFTVDGEWHVPEDAPGRVTDEFGRRNATLVVAAEAVGGGA